MTVMNRLAGGGLKFSGSWDVDASILSNAYKPAEGRAEYEKAQKAFQNVHEQIAALPDSVHLKYTQPGKWERPQIHITMASGLADGKTVRLESNYELYFWRKWSQFFSFESIEDFLSRTLRFVTEAAKEYQAR